MRFPLGPGPYRERLLDAMAWLLVDLHRAGVYWGDCSLANTLFRRDGDKIQAFLVDAETSEIHPSLSDGQRGVRPRHPRRERRLRPRRRRGAAGTPGGVRRRGGGGRDGPLHAIARSGTSCTTEPELPPYDRHAVRARIRRLNDLGFAVDEITHGADRRARDPSGAVRLNVAVSNRRFHARQLERLTGLRRPRGPGAAAAQRPPRVPGLARVLRRAPGRRAGGRRPLARARCSSPPSPCSRPAVGEGRDLLQAYCDVLEEKWILSELGRPGRRARGGPRRVPRPRRAGAGGRSGRERDLDRPRHRLVDGARRARRRTPRTTARPRRRGLT